jgi:hypothetical protein
MTNAKTGRPSGTAIIPNAKTVKFRVCADEWAAIQQLARTKQKSEAAIMRDLVRAIAA